MPKLKNCPFCDSNEIRYDYEAYNGIIDSRLYVECKSCKSRFYIYGKTIQEAISCYNREMVEKEVK